jgi:glycine hydroxymethyltransferase
MLIDKALMNHDNDTILAEVRKEVNGWMQQYPLFAESEELVAAMF